jgi:cell wall-associated NlpC family hydrolase
MEKTSTSICVEGAITWALAHVGSNAYAYLCYGFLEDAYELGNHIVLDGKGTTAREAADAYQARPGEPPRGSYVFFNCSGPIEGVEKNYGHIGLALGDGRMVHAWGVVRVDAIAEVENLPGAPGWTNPEYLGWAPPELILEGMRIE